MCSIDFDSRPDFYRKHHPVARKAHRCVVCRGPISPGERYLRESGKWEGDMFSDACCLSCAADRDQFGEAHDGFPFANSFFEFLSSCLYEGDPESDRVWGPMHERIQARRATA